jgi:glycosidase
MKNHARAVLFATGLTLLVPRVASPAPYPSPTDWRNESIYQIITDRFYDGNPSNDNVEASRGSPYDPTANAGIHGGDFQGIQDKLDYIKALGATAIWISPIPLNVGDGTSAYHGYAAQDFYALAPHWGTMTDLSNMVQAAHARGIKVILDIVCNHTGNLIGSTDPGWPNYLAPPAGYNMSYYNINNQHAFPFNPTNVVPPLLSTIFHTNGQIQSFNYPSDTQQVVLGELDGLNDLATETTYVRTNLMNIYTNWVGLADFDAFRVDTAIEVDYGFWQYWCPQLHQFGTTIGKSNFFMFGEAFSSSEQQVGSYTGTKGGGPFKFDSMLDYPLYDTVNSVFATASGNTQQIVNHYNAIATNYDTNSAYRLVTFLDNHDNPRFLSSGDANGNTNNLTVALQFLYTSRGIPCLYYGTEQGFEGDNNNNDNREDMFAGQWQPQVPVTGDNFNETSLLFQQVAKLNNFRRLYPALHTGVHNNLWSTSSGPGLFAYSRVLSNQEVFVCFNTAASSQTLTNLPTTYSSGTVLVNLLNTNDTIVVTTALGTNTTPLITVPGTTAKIYLAQSLVLPLDPVVISQSPAHAAACISTSSPIVLQFSKPMNTNSVQAAFPVTPATTGTFTWSTLHDTMTFTPSTAWHTFTTNLVHLATNAVDAVSGNSLYAPFDTYFVTFTTNTITTSSSPAGGGTTSGGGTVNCGSNVTVCATPNSCYSFVYWTQNSSLASTTACYTFSATGNESVVANFANGQATLAIDNAADPSYSVVQYVWSSGSNGGTGFDPWALVETFTNHTCNGFFSNTSINNDSPPHAPPGIDTNGKAWGIYANSVNCGGPAVASAYRAFAIGPLQVGGQFLIDMENGLNDTAGATVGFTLRNGDATNSPADYTTGARFQFYLGGGNADYTVVDAAGAYDSGVPLTYSGLHLVFTLGANDSYTLAIISYGTGLTNIISGTLGGTAGTTLNSIALFNNDNGPGPPHDVFFNSLTMINVTPFIETISTISSPPNGGTTVGGGIYNCGASVTVTATPAAGYGFASWTEGGTNVSTLSSYTFTVSASRTLVANFTLQPTPFQVWQLQYFGCTNCPQAAASADPDGDGYNNLQEFVSGTDPTNSSSHPTNIPPYLVGWWKLDEESGSIASDSSENGNTGIVELGDGDWTSGMVNGALFFDGESTQVSVTNSPSLNPTNAITIAAWVNAGGWFNNTRILEKGRSDNQYGLLINGPGQLEFLLAGVTNGTLLTSPPSTGAWHHLAATYNGTLISLYIDGQSTAHQSASGPLAITTDPLAIGTRPSGGPLFVFYGIIDDVRIYDTALSASQIAQLYNTDSIGDGIANRWRQQYFGNGSMTGATTCATCDFDGTGQNNLFKYVTGLDPTDPTSVFYLQIASVTNQTAQQNLLFNPLASGREYTPQYSTDLVNGVWMPLVGYSGPVTNGDKVTITDTNAVPPRKFYRIDISYP